eukprot:scaffold394603_cov32-Prasinocladus_malaysianus.AAC.1
MHNMDVAACNIHYNTLLLHAVLDMPFRPCPRRAWVISRARRLSGRLMAFVHHNHRRTRPASTSHFILDTIIPFLLHFHLLYTMLLAVSYA